MRALVLAISLFMAGTAMANAVQIAAFGQSSGSNTVTATDNGTNTATTISISSAAVGITQLFANSPVGALFGLTATSIDPVTAVGGALIQHYNGSFCLTSGAGCSGINYLSGAFTDAAFGVATGTQLSVNVADPTDTLSLTSGVIPAADLNPPSSFTLSFSNLIPSLGIQGTTIAPFTASFSGVASANVLAVPEPSTLAVFGAGVIGLLTVARRRRSS